MAVDVASLQNGLTMPSNTRQLMRELREDHRNIGLILDILQHSIDSASSNSDPDFELAEDIMRYMTVYSDAVHHPKEDIVYAELKDRRPDLADGLDDVPADHLEIAALGQVLRNDVQAILAGGAVRREQFVTDAGAFVNRLRNHMRWEEDDLFKRIDRMCEDESIEVDVDHFTQIKDPVFELEIESGFRRLLEAIRT